jgi:hypothetical protein
VLAQPTLSLVGAAKVAFKAQMDSLLGPTGRNSLPSCSYRGNHMFRSEYSCPGCHRIKKLKEVLR